jgi:hypothetical protein
MSGFGFFPGSGTNFSNGEEPEIAHRLDARGKKLHLKIYGISGYRSSAHSVEVGGSANDPHTTGAAADIGVGGLTRASASQLTDQQLASVGLYRPFPGANEINHVQIKKGPSGHALVSLHTLGIVGKDVIEGPIGVVSDLSGGRIPDPLSITGKIAGAAGGVAEDAAKAGFTWGFNQLWDAVSSKAEYAALFVVLLGVGAWAAVSGLKRATRSPEGAPA